MVMINLAILLIIIGYAAIWGHYLIGSILVLGLMVVDVMGYGMQHSPFLVACELAIVLMVIRETKERGDNSLLLKFNPAYRNNRIPRGLQTVILSVFILAFLIRFVDLLLPKSFVGGADAENERKALGQMRVNEIIAAYRQGQDYHAVAKRKGFPADKFVDGFIEVMVAEYERLDKLKENLTRVESLPIEARLARLRELSNQCQCETSNVVDRMEKAYIGEDNSRRLARQFILLYRHVNTTISDQIMELGNRSVGAGTTNGFGR